MKQKKNQAAYVVIEKNVSDLKAYKQNARNHPQDQINRIAMSIKKFGFRIPLLITKDDVIVTGHGRLLAAKKLKLNKVPCLLTENMTEAEIKAFRIADNKVADTSWDLDMLALEFKELNAMKFDLSLTGFKNDELSFFNLDKKQGENNADEEWKGMPEFENEDKTAHRTILIHFMDDESVQKFAKLVNQQITEKTRYLYFPAQERNKTKLVRY